MDCPFRELFALCPAKNPCTQTQFYFQNDALNNQGTLMCTLTWRDAKEGREVYFNRDELKTRSRALPPQEFLSPRGLRFLAPTDPEGGGAWMAVNEAGLLICLLNRWQETSEGGQRSRGLVVRTLAGCETLREATEGLEALVQETRAFELVLFQGSRVLGKRWTEGRLTTFEPLAPLTSSSYQLERVREARLARYATVGEDLASYHGNLETPATAFSVRMNRPDAQTWSRSRVCLSPTLIEWDYWEEFPDLQTAAQLHQSQLPCRSRDKQ